MATIVINYCDRCGIDDYKEEIQFWNIGFGFACADSPYNRTPTIAPINTKKWCRKCMLEANLIGDKNLQMKELKTKNLPDPPTFEDLFTELIQQVIDEQ